MTGKVSGNLECIDFDNHGELFEAWKALIDPALFARLVIESTQSGGYHVYYRCGEPVGRRQILASGIRPNESTKKDSDPDELPRVLIETRSEGETSVCAPSIGYEAILGDLTRLPVISAAERDTLLDAARAFNEIENQVSKSGAPDNAVCAQSIKSGSMLDDRWEIRPGDDYNARGDLNALLERHGWTFVRRDEREGCDLWRRPGTDKDKSASFKDGNFHVFTTSVPELAAGPGGKPDFDKFGVYARLEHGGNLVEATKALASLGCGRAKKTPGVVINLGAKTPTAEQDEDTEANADAMPDPGPMPDGLLDVPGFIHDLIEVTLATAPYPNRPLAFAGAIAMAAHLAGRHYKTVEFSIRPNLFLLSLAASGSGKQHPRSVNSALASELGIAETIAEYFASGEGLEDALAGCPAMLFQVDEADTLFNAVKQEDSRSEMMKSMLLRLFTESAGSHTTRKKALNPNQRGCLPPEIKAPHLTFMGSAVPRFFYASLSEKTITNGLLARCLVLEAGGRGDANNSMRDIEFPEVLLEQARTILGAGTPVDYSDSLNSTPMGDASVAPKQRVVEFNEDGRTAFIEARRDADDM